jgi:hypothetical protein
MSQALAVKVVHLVARVVDVCLLVVGNGNEEDVLSNNMA